VKIVTQLSGKKRSAPSTTPLTSRDLRGQAPDGRARAVVEAVASRPGHPEGAAPTSRAGRHPLRRHCARHPPPSCPEADLVAERRGACASGPIGV
jgi:hypothetical protein